jgi:hypothetical protein
VKFPLAWHRDILENRKANLARSEARLREQQKLADRSRADLQWYGAQIAEAERRGITEFDRERFGVKRK